MSETWVGPCKLPTCTEHPAIHACHVLIAENEQLRKELEDALAGGMAQAKEVVRLRKDRQALSEAAWGKQHERDKG